MVRALAIRQCVRGSIPGLGVICGLSLLVLYSAPRAFSPGTLVFPSPQKPTLSKFQFDSDTVDDKSYYVDATVKARLLLLLLKLRKEKAKTTALLVHELNNSIGWNNNNRPSLHFRVNIMCCDSNFTTRLRNFVFQFVSTPRLITFNHSTTRYLVIEGRKNGTRRIYCR